VTAVAACSHCPTGRFDVSHRGLEGICAGWIDEHGHRDSLRHKLAQQLQLLARKGATAAPPQTPHAERASHLIA
jgi:hypothetical protein